MVLAWVSGVIAGVILMERWRRRGSEYVPVEILSDSLDETFPGSSSGISGRRPHVVGLVVTGAKLDVERVRRLLRPVDVPHSA